MRSACLGIVLVASMAASGPAHAECTFRMAQQMMGEAMQAFERLQARDPQRARQIEGEVQRRMASAPMTVERVESDNSPVPDAMCDFWEDVLDLIED